MDLSNLKSTATRKSSKRVGRGYGSGRGGHTSGRGTKGQNSRKGHKFGLGFEGGQVPLFKRLPQIGGFTNHSSKAVLTVYMSDLNKFKEGDELTPIVLLKKGIISYIPRYGVKILKGGELKKKLVLKGFAFSKGAREEVEKSGSSIND